MNAIIRRFVLIPMLPLVLAMPSPPASAGAGKGAEASLYQRLGGYDAITAVVDDVVAQIAADKKLGRFWAHRGDDGITREKQLIVDFIVAKAGGPLYYTGREMKLSHQGMRIDEEDWKILIEALQNSLSKFSVPARERQDVLDFFESTRKDIVEKS